ncbi:MAG: hypothetical protein LBI73_05585 [Myroides sp.]|nr:hypothetical protein [Myroides sp.]
MKNYFKAVALILVSGMGIVSCGSMGDASSTASTNSKDITKDESKNPLRFLGITWDDMAKMGEKMDADQFLGKVSFKSSDKNIVNDKDGTVEILNIMKGPNYYITFSDKIPSLVEIKMIRQEDGSLINKDATETKMIKVQGKKIHINYTEDGKTWKADAEIYY